MVHELDTNDYDFQLCTGTKQHIAFQYPPGVYFLEMYDGLFESVAFVQK